MRFGDILRLCRQNLWRRKSRTILTVLGVIVGCCSIVLMVSLGQGINEQNEKMLKSMGDRSLLFNVPIPRIRTVADPLGFPSAVIFIPGTRP